MLLIIPLLSAISLLNFADSIYCTSHFYDAATEYERFLYHFPSDSNLNFARHQLGLSYLKANEPDKAENILRKIMNSSNSYSRRSQLSLVEYFLENSKYSQAQLELQDLLLFTKDSNENRQLHRLLGWIDLKENNFSRAEEQFVLAKDSLLVKETQSLRWLPRKNPLLALALSTILPGTGEIYSGHYWIGISAFLINAGSIAAIVYSVNKKNYVDMALIFSIVFSRFYMGSRQNAYDFANDYNQELYNKQIELLNQRYNLFGNH